MLITIRNFVNYVDYTGFWLGDYYIRFKPTDKSSYTGVCKCYERHEWVEVLCELEPLPSGLVALYLESFTY